MKKVLLITYYWPPMAGGGVPRIVKFAKYLKRKNWEPVILTSGRVNTPSVDKSFIKDIEGIKVITTRKHKEFKKSHESHLDKEKPNNAKSSIFIDRLKNFIRINFLIPDTKIWWYWKAFKKAKEIIRSENFDAIFTTSPPYTVQLIGLSLKKIFNMPWIVDFRDPWTENVYYNSSYRNPVTTKINSYLENKVLEKADLIITVGEKLKLLLKEKTNKKIEVIHNGFDTDDYSSINIKKSSNDRKFVIGYYGSFNKFQVPYLLFEVIKEFKVNNPEIYESIKVKIFGNITNEAKDILEGKIEKEKLEVNGFLPHDSFVEHISQEQILLQLIHDQEDSEIIIGSKLYEYFFTGNPVLCIGNTNSEGAQLVTKVSSINGTFDFSNKEGVKNFIIDMYKNWKKDEMRQHKIDVSTYSRSNLTEQLIDAINNYV